jgi:hypothetical protein
MLFLMRTGRASKAATVEVDAPEVKLTTRESAVVAVSGVLGPLCLFPLGLVPVGILLADADLKLWFLPFARPRSAALAGGRRHDRARGSTRFTKQSGSPSRAAVHAGDRSAVPADDEFESV